MSLFPSVALVKKEFVTRLRGKGIFFFVLSVALVAMALTISQWPESSEGLEPARMSSIARTMFVLFVVMLVAGCALLVPGIAGTAISVEREQDTLDLLSITLVRPEGMVLAKVLNIVGTYLLLIVAVLPVFGCVFFTVGVDLKAVTGAVLICVAVAISCATIGICCSALFFKTQVSVVVSYLVCWLVPVGGWMVIPLMFFGPFFYHSLMSGLIPVLAILQLTSSGNGGALYVTLLVQLSLAAVSFLLTLRFIRRQRNTVKGTTQKLVDDPAVLAARRRKFPYYLIDPAARQKPIPDHRNPMLRKELQEGLIGRGPAMIRWLYGSFIVFLLADIVILFALEGSPGRAYMGAIGGMMIVRFAVILLFTPALVGNALSKEHERGNMDMLRMTLLSSWNIVCGKLFAGFIAVSPLLVGAALPSAPLGMMALQKPCGISLYFTFWVTLSECVLLSLSIGLFASVMTRRTSVSMGLSYGLNFVACIGLATIVPSLLKALASSLFIPDRRSLSAGWTLLEGCCEVLQEFSSPILAFFSNMYTYRVLDPLCRGSFITPYWLSVTLLHALVIGALAWLSVRRFSTRLVKDRDR